METKEIMTNEEVVEMTEGMANSKRGLKIAAGVGVAALASVLAYKCIIKPIAAKIKAKKEERMLEGNIEYLDARDSDECEEE